MSDAADADDTFALLNALGVEKCVAIGHSAGNAHARQMFLSRPSRVEAAVFIDGLYYFSGKASRLGTERYSPEWLFRFR
jgi:pimeloyl-ACP methyl ester carboxylesterase